MGEFPDVERLIGVQRFLESDVDLWIDGQSHRGSGASIAVLNPATGGTLTTLRSAGPKDIDAAVDAAGRAFNDGRWRRWTPSRRAATLWKIADLVERDGQDLAQLEMLDNGKPLQLAAGIDVASAAANFRYFAGWIDKFGGETNPVSWPEHLNYTLREPIGVCGVIIPWNFPLLMASRYLAPALAMGNSVVLKPAEQTPLTALWLARLCEEAGVPSGVVNVAPGLGEVAGARLAEHPDVEKISFTGGQSAAREVMAASQVNFKRLSLELGGKNPQIVFGDADIEKRLPGIVAGGFYNTGQNCAAGARVYVHSKASANFADAAAAFVANLRVGPGWLENIDLGPLISLEHLQHVTEMLQSGQDTGARIIEGGRRPGETPMGGFFLSPTVVEVARDDNVLIKDEIFGPVITISEFDDVDEVVSRANASRYGLVAGLWTEDLSVAHRVASQLRFGTVWINGWDRWDPASPFGGYKQSGYGHSYGLRGLEEFSLLKSVWVNHGDA